MSIETPEEVVGLRAAGSVVSLMLKSMKEAVEVGVTTAELDEVVLASCANSQVPASELSSSRPTLAPASGKKSRLLG